MYFYSIYLNEATNDMTGIFSVILPNLVIGRFLANQPWTKLYNWEWWYLYIQRVGGYSIPYQSSNPIVGIMVWYNGWMAVSGWNNFDQLPYVFTYTYTLVMVCCPQSLHMCVYTYTHYIGILTKQPCMGHIGMGFQKKYLRHQKINPARVQCFGPWSPGLVFWSLGPSVLGDSALKHFEDKP